MITLTPGWAGFLKGIIGAVVLVLVDYLAVASHLSGILPIGTAGIVAGIFSMIESSMKATSGGTAGLFGAVKIKNV